MRKTPVLIRALMLAAAAAPFAVAPPVLAQEASQPFVVSYRPSIFDRLRAQTALEMIRRLPSFVYEATGTGAGIDARAGNVLINGKRPATEGITLDEVLRRIPAGQVETINIIRGASPGIEMQGRTVVANIVLRPSATFKGVWSASGTALPDGRVGGSLRVETQRRRDSETIDLSLDLQRNPSNNSHGQRIRTRSDGVVTTQTDIASLNVQDRIEGRAGYDGKILGGRLRLNGGAYKNTTDNKPGQNDPAGNRSQGEQAREDATLRFGRKIGARNEVETRLFQQQTENISESISNGGRNVFRSVRNSGERIGFVSMRHVRSPAVTVEGGGEVGYVWQNGFSSFAIDGVPTGGQNISAQTERLRQQVYVNTIWKKSAELQLEGALRVENETLSVSGDRPSEQTFSYLRPRVALTWNPDTRTQVVLSIDGQVDPVDLNNFIATFRRNETDDQDEVVGGASDLLPESRLVSQARYQKRWGKVGVFSITAAHTEMSDIVDRVFVAGSGTSFFEAPGNIGDGRRDLALITLDMPVGDPAGGEVLLRLRATWRDSSITDPITGEARRVSGEAPFEWEARLSRDFTDGKVRLGVDVTGNAPVPAWRPFETSVTERAPNVQVYAEYRARPDVTMRAEVRNAADREVRTVRTVYGPGGRRSGAPVYQEARDTRTAAQLYVNLRRTF